MRWNARIAATALSALTLLCSQVGAAQAKPAAPAEPTMAAIPASAARAAAASVADRVRGAILGICIGDALSMPVHWYYNPLDIVRDFGRIRDYAAPKAKHPSSIMHLSNTGGAGRGGQAGSIIGDVINHGKKKYWGVHGVHYHATLSAGDNTLNAQCARLLVRTITGSGGAWSPDAWLAAYVAFMTTPGSHNDAYAETYHRMFFKNYVAGKAPKDCADDDGHNVASMGGMVTLPPVALLAAASASATTASAAASASPSSTGGSAGATPAAAIAAARDATARQMYTTHNSKQLEAYARAYAELVARVLHGEDLRTAIGAVSDGLRLGIPALAARAAASGAPDTDVIGGGGVFSSACYIEESFPALLYLAYRYADDPEAAVVANTNVGGENCHRGSALAALMGLAHGASRWPARWLTGLREWEAIDGEARAFAALVAGKMVGEATGDASGGGAAAAAAAGGAAAVAPGPPPAAAAAVGGGAATTAATAAGAAAAVVVVGAGGEVAAAAPALA